MSMVGDFSTETMRPANGGATSLQYLKKNPCQSRNLFLRNTMKMRVKQMKSGYICFRENFFSKFAKFKEFFRQRDMTPDRNSELKDGVKRSRNGYYG